MYIKIQHSRSRIIGKTEKDEELNRNTQVNSYALCCITEQLHQKIKNLKSKRNPSLTSFNV